MNKIIGTIAILLAALYPIIFLVSPSFAQPPYTPPPPPPVPLIPFKAEKVSFQAMTWNGDYWLMATTKGDLVKYDGREFTYIKNLRVSHIAWSGAHWLLSIGRGAQKEKGLVKYDGEEFVTLSQDYSPQVIACADYCLMWGDPWDMRLMKYDGNLVDLTMQFREQAGLEYVFDILWNGDYWLISTGKALVKYDGNAFSKLDLGISPEKLRVFAVAWNGNYWLISAGEMAEGYVPRIFKYTEELVEIPVPDSFDVSHLREKYEAAGASITTTYLIPHEMKWNGDYWLMSTGMYPFLVKYDGSSFEVIEPPPSAYEIKKLAWNGEYWLVYYFAAPRERNIARYDGEKFEDLGVGFKVLEFMEWSDGYWLLGGRGEDGSLKLVKYEGAAFTDLTPQFMAALPFSIPKKTLIGALLVAIVAGYMIWRRRK